MRPKDIFQIAALTIPFMCIISINLIAKIYNKVEAGEQERESAHRQAIFISFQFDSFLRCLNSH